MKVKPQKKDYDPVKASLFNSFTTVSAILLLMNSVFNVMVYTTRNKNFKGTCYLLHATIALATIINATFSNMIKMK